MLFHFSTTKLFILSAALLSAYTDIALSNLLGVVSGHTHMHTLSSTPSGFHLCIQPVFVCFPLTCAVRSPSKQLGCNSDRHTDAVADRKKPQRIQNPYWKSNLARTELALAQAMVCGQYECN